MDFISVGINLKSNHHPMVITHQSGIYAHAAVLQAVSNRWPDLGKSMHDYCRYKPFTIAFFEKKPKENGCAILRISVFGDQTVERMEKILEALFSEQHLRIGNQTFQVDSIDDANTSPWTMISSWDDLCSIKPRRKIKFEFITPTAITKRGWKDSSERPSQTSTVKFWEKVDQWLLTSDIIFFSPLLQKYFKNRESGRNIGRVTALFPSPMNIFIGLSNRWRYLGGPALPNHFVTYLSQGACVECRYNLNTVEFSIREWKQIGFVGSLVFEVLTVNTEFSTTLASLTQFSQFTGIGYSTAKGMGCVRTTIYS